MATYIHIFQDSQSQEAAHKTSNPGFKQPWVSSFLRHVRGTKYVVKYNKNLDVSTDFIEFTSYQSSTTINIDAFYSWSVTNNVPWITVSPLSHTSGESILTVSVSENTGENARSGNFEIINSAGFKKIITVNQSRYSSAPSVIWVDDFNEQTTESYWTWYFANSVVDQGGTSLANKYVYTGEEMEYDGDTFYLYELDNLREDFVKYALIPKSYTYDYLYPLSIEANHSNRFEAFTYVLGDDFSVSYGGALSLHFTLVKVEE